MALEFGEQFATPGCVYLTFAADQNQLLVQRQRPADNAPFYVAHVARTHRWLKQVTHFAPSRQSFWRSHVAVATGGFVDAFAIMHESVPLALANNKPIDAALRDQLIGKIMCDELILCAGRSDGWLVRTSGALSHAGVSQLARLPGAAVTRGARAAPRAAAAAGAPRAAR